jgi:hypothetical protein
METALLSEIEISQYCRKKGLFPQQIQEWKVACEKWLATGLKKILSKNLGIL